MRGKAPTLLEYALLGLLHTAPQSGYDLRKVFATTAMSNFSSSPGAIYPALKRLESKGLIAGTIDSGTELRPRKIFAPESKGRDALKQWLQFDIEPGDVARNLDELMLRLAFHWILDDLAATRAFVATLAQELDRYVEDLEGQRADFPDHTPVQSRLALDAGIEQYKAAARWAHTSVRKLEEDGS